MTALVVARAACVMGTYESELPIALTDAESSGLKHVTSTAITRSP